MDTLNFVFLLICTKPCFGQWFHPRSGGGNGAGDGRTGPASLVPPLYPVPSSPYGFPSDGRVIGGAGHQSFPQNFQFDPTTMTGDEYGTGGTGGGLYPTAGYHLDKPPQNGQNDRYIYSTAPGSGGLSQPPSNSKSISGDYCFEPILSCDTTNTVLYCIKGRCTCPSQWTLSPGNLPLNTVWHPELRRCVSIAGSGCHSVRSSYQMRSPSSPYYKPSPSSPVIGGGADPSPPSSSQSKEIASSIIKGLIGMPSGGGGNGYVYCQPGVECRRHPGNQEVGICGAAQMHAIKSYLVIGVVSLYYWLRIC